MQSHKNNIKPLIILAILVIILFFTNISLGSVHIPIKDIIQTIFGDETVKDSWQYIIFNYRLPKAITAIIVGGGLGISGLLMQTLFRNPLAGPYVLGLSSGASLGVAIVILGSSIFGITISGLLMSKWSLIIASSMGSLLVLLAVVIMSIRIKNTMAILIIGLMFASVTGAIVSVLSYFSTAENLQRYLFWGFGSLGDLSWHQVRILSVLFGIGIVLTIVAIKSLNALLLGDNYARSLGIDIKKHRFIIILATSILAGSITAFVGPIAFIGLAVPHLTKLLFDTSNHKIIVPAVLLSGAILMLICDSIAQLPNSQYTLPINAVTSLIGAPVVIWLLVRKRKLFV